MYLIAQEQQKVKGESFIKFPSLSVGIFQDFASKSRIGNQ